MENVCTHKLTTGQQYSVPSAYFYTSHFQQLIKHRTVSTPQFVLLSFIDTRQTPEFWPYTP